MIFFELVRTRPNHLGWAGSSGPLHYSHTTWTVEKKTQKKEQEVEEEGEADLQWLLSLAVMLVAKWRWLQAAVLLLLSSASLLFLFFSSSIIIFLFLSVFSSFPLLFCSFLLLPLLLFPFAPPSALSLPYIYRQKNRGRDSPTTPAQSSCRGRVAGAATMQLPKGYIPSIFPPCGKQVGSFCRYLFKLFWRKGEEKSRGRKSSSSPASRVQGKKKTHTVVQNGTVWVFVFFKKTVDETTSFYQNAPFHLKEMVPKTCQYPTQSSICDLFNQVLNSNFDFKYQFNCILAKFNFRP